MYCYQNWNSHILHYKEGNLFGMHILKLSYIARDRFYFKMFSTMEEEMSVLDCLSHQVEKLKLRKAVPFNMLHKI